MAQSSKPANRTRTPSSGHFRSYISQHWAQRPESPTPQSPVAPYARARRAAVAAEFLGTTLVLPAGPERTRSNDTAYRYRSHSAFAHLTGWGSATVPDSVLVLDPSGAATLYFRAPAGRDSDEFYANPAIGEFWTGPRPGLAEVARSLDLPTKDLADLDDDLDRDDAPVATIRGVDPRIDGMVDALKRPSEHDADLARFCSELRFVKDDYELGEMRAAVAATIQGFERIAGDLPRIVGHERGERVVDGTFIGAAREYGYDVGYDTIAASGPHACTLHWTRNDGPVRDGDLLLIDAGVEMESYYTADLTRTIPVSGTFSPEQRQVYEAVLEAADAAFAIARPGVRFREIHQAAMAVIARKVSEWGWLPIPLEQTLDPAYQLHRRYMVHGTSHHLGIDVHDCALARNEMYVDGVLEPGMVFTIEPGLYLQPDDLTVPEAFRGIGVRIEDDVLVTEDGVENLTAGIPRDPDELEAWLTRLRRS